jgi:hypothetical protein
MNDVNPVEKNVVAKEILMIDENLSDYSHHFHLFPA